MKLFQQIYGEDDPAIIILHGILGSGRNWHTAAKILAANHRVIVPDLRNHGRSPHSDMHRIAGMVDDVISLQQQTQASPSILLGHSMGGLIACEVAFQSSMTVQALIVVDITPRSHRGDVIKILTAMKNIDLSSIKNKNEVDEKLSPSIPDPIIRQFILTNLSTDGEFKWRVNLPALYDYLIDMRAYSPAPSNVYNGPALFLRGERSDYIQQADEKIIQQHCPQAEIVTIPNAGHWVHYDNLPALVSEVKSFIEKVI
ncbi:MAG: alpha/beta fold hydrolase [Calditrichaeota bacterium]|nr:MAG: alpha/beta fold hydrolase [Calditrichota bacterium]